MPFCLEDCHQCETAGEVIVTLKPDGSADIVHTGDCIRYGMEGCIRDGDKCAWEVKARYLRVGNKIYPASCNYENYSANGEGSFDDERTSGRLSCISGGQFEMILPWHGLKKL